MCVCVWSPLPAHMVNLAAGGLEGISLNSWVGATNLLAECKTCYNYCNNPQYSSCGLWARSLR